ncbi:hypothetical protein CSQ86_01885 [Bifidobacterium felsineum]|uniref:FHA domain-containing protein n=1 Tax=Bifidobacterium felsineum TaxID=2045440 RepID=A0A2M9HMX3_9BIFI|nr:hypothetical protein CSQ86_01885 [Bifidobacterium felsineum]
MARNVVCSVFRKAVTVSEWTVRINGVDQVSVKPGNSVEIGRKPLRPLAADGAQRLDVTDQTKSMSKRHALFTVNENGSASVRDLGSTNGSYVVRDNGDLLRLPPNADFLLPVSPMRMQFGDVPADFIRIDEPSLSEQKPIPDLFGYAASDAPQEPDAADMSVDDILDLRAGEPTAMFSASSVKHKVDELEIGSLNIVQLNQKPEEPALPRDLFADAEAKQQEEEEQRKAKEAMDAVALPEPVEPEPKSALRPGIRISGLVPVDAIAHPAHVQPHVVPSVEPAQTEPSTAPVEQTEPEHAEPEAPAAQKDPTAQEPSQQSPIADAGAASAATAFAGQPTDQSQTTDASQSDAAAAESTESEPVNDAGQTATEPVESAAGQQTEAEQPEPQNTNPALVFEPIKDTANENADGTVIASGEPDSADTSETANAATATNDADMDANGGYKPAFEPGSVFDRVAKGELKAQEPVVEVAGLSSNDAKTTQDFSLQFEIARHPELLAFLAMNPYLYDDMYAWLAARGEADIDEALAHNKGYQEYREAVGK